MLRLMYGSSRWGSCGSTENRCTKAGHTPPARNATAIQMPTAASGSESRLNLMFTRNNSAEITEMIASNRSAGSCAWTSV